MVPFEIVAEDVTVATSWSTLLTKRFKGRAEEIWFEIDNTGSTTLSDFSIQIRAHQDAAFEDWLEGADFGVAELPSLIFCPSTGPQELTNGTACTICVNVHRCEAVRLRAKVASSTTTVTVRSLVAMEG